MNKSKIIVPIFLCLLLIDFSYSFLQYYNSPLRGDIEGGVVPSKDVQQIFEDPFGFHMLESGEKHVNPNRYFAHLFLFKYFRNFPIWLQSVVEPITSVYLSCAIVKIVVQLLFVYILSSIITGQKSLLNKDLLLGAILIEPLFQVYGYYSTIGIIDKAPAYTFFYAVPLLLLLLFLIPFFRTFYGKDNSKINPFSYLYLVPLVVVLPLSGPLIPGVILIISTLIFIRSYLHNRRIYNYSVLKSIFLVHKRIPSSVLWLFIPAALLSLYSLFLGLYDSNYSSASIPVIKRYAQLPTGLYLQLTHALGFPLLLAVIGYNIHLIRKHFSSSDYQHLVTVFKWIGAFAILYIILLPLGGYRPYRPFIARHDTMMPVTIGMFYVFGASSYYLIKNLNIGFRKKYSVILIISLLVFIYADKPNFNQNKCEKESLEIIADSTDSIVALTSDCTFLSWSRTTDYKNSGLKSELLYLWKVTDERKLFYQTDSISFSGRNYD